MADDTLALQAAVISALRADATLGLLVGQRVYDQPPQDAAAPYVQISSVIGRPFEASQIDGWECVLTLDTWSDAFGAVECREIMAAIYDALHDCEIVVTGRALVMARLSDQRDMAEDGGAWRHGVQRFEFITHI